MNTETIVLGGGCFWCLEAVYQLFRGVETVTNGYAGGTVPDPTYDQVCTGETGHAEVVKIKFNPSVISLKTILEIFWVIHDPTSLNKQGFDIGTEYRSVIFYQTEEQKKISDSSLTNDGQPLWPKRIVTQITKLDTFYEAESYHQGYFNNHPESAYCQVIINPKLSKIRQKFFNLIV